MKGVLILWNDTVKKGSLLPFVGNLVDTKSADGACLAVEEPTKACNRSGTGAPTDITEGARPSPVPTG